MVKKLFGLAIFALILAAFLGAAPAAAAEIPGVTTVAATAPQAGGCGQAPVLPAKGETCSAAHDSSDCGGASCDQTISCC
ncbi:MAG: hypothetical protein DMF53_11975 [Acidobacteria bacterium]|nr:MAG: hypothetical protein DMF53_11975 [Acidobacteriota bacterium]